MSNNKFIVNNLAFVEENLKDPWPPKFYAANYKSNRDHPSNEKVEVPKIPLN